MILEMFRSLILLGTVPTATSDSVDHPFKSNSATLASPVRYSKVRYVVAWRWSRDSSITNSARADLVFQCPTFLSSEFYLQRIAITAKTFETSFIVVARIIIIVRLAKMTCHATRAVFIMMCRRKIIAFSPSKTTPFCRRNS